MDFVEPPPPKRKTNSEHWVNVVKTLKAEPGEWGLAGNWSVGVSTHNKTGRYPAFYPTELPKEDREAYIADHWEITTRTNGTNRVDLYVRWIGEA
jgi:hypothetical protein